jgi:AraC-like DNA-binding protein
LPTEPTVDARWARLVVDLLESKGIASENVLRQAGLTPLRVSDPDRRIPFRQHAQLFEAAAEATKEPYLGLKLGAKVQFEEVGLLGYVALNSPTFGQALENIARYHRVLTEGFRLGLEVDQHHAVFAAVPADPTAVVGRQVVEFAACLLVRLCRQLTARKLAPLWVQFVHAPPPVRSRYVTAFKAPVHFEQPRIALVFSKDVLSVPVRSADHHLLRILEGYCREILGKARAESDIVYDVRQVMAKLLSGGVPTLERVAAEMNTSVRTLERRLKERDWTYRRLGDDLRRQLALRYLKDPRIKPAQLSFLLGFSENAAFIHAFRRWTGSTPMRYRAAALAPSGRRAAVPAT